MNRLTGMQLHALYRAQLARQGVDSDDWHDIDETDRAAWNGLADALQEM